MIEAIDMPPEAAPFIRFHVIVKPSPEAPVIRMDDASSLTGDASQSMQGLLEFIDIVTSQPVFDAREHITFTTHSSYLRANCFHMFGFRENELPVLGSHTRLRPGAMKSARYIEGASKREIGLVVECKLIAF